MNKSGRLHRSNFGKEKKVEERNGLAIELNAFDVESETKYSKTDYLELSLRSSQAPKTSFLALDLFRLAIREPCQPLFLK